MRRSLLGSPHTSVVTCDLPPIVNKSPTLPPKWPAVMKYFLLITVPRKPLHRPCHCQPLLTKAPVGAEVLRFGVDQRMTPRAGIANDETRRIIVANTSARRRYERMKSP